jgi:hypothetical protein
MRYHPGRRGRTALGVTLGAAVVLGATGVAYADASTPAAPAGPAAPGAAPAAPAAPAKPRPHLDGVVTALTNGHLTIKDPDGFTRQIAIAQVPQGITTGTRIHAEGSVDRDGTTLDATTVTVGRPPALPGHPPVPPAGGAKPAPPQGGPARPPAAPGAKAKPPAAPAGPPSTSQAAPSASASSGS